MDNNSCLFLGKATKCLGLQLPLSLPDQDFYDGLIIFNRHRMLKKSELHFKCGTVFF